MEKEIKSNNKTNKFWDRYKTFFICWGVLVFFEMIEYISMVYPQLVRKKYAILCLLSWVLLFALDFIKPLRKFAKSVLDFCGKQIKKITYIKYTNWRKFIVVLLIDLALSLLLLFLFCGTGRFYAKIFVFIFVCVFLTSLLFTFKNLLIEKIELMVFVFVMGIGTLFVTLLPTSCGLSWDDEVHFLNSLKLSHEVDFHMTPDDYLILNNFPSTALEHNLYDEKSDKEWMEHMADYQANEELIPVGRLLPKLEHWGYIPAACGLTIGRACHLPYAWTFALGKMFNLFTYALLLYFSIKKIKSGKMIIAAVGMLPPCILLASSYSKDFWMIGFLMLGFSYFFGEIQRSNKPIELSQVAVIWISFLFGIGTKAVYVPIILTLFFMPKSKFKDKKALRNYRIAIIVLGVILLATFALPYVISSGSAFEDVRGGDDVDAGAQTAYILSDPFGYSKTLSQFMFKYVSLKTASKNLTYCVYLGTTKFALLIMMLLAVVTFTDRNSFDDDIKAPVKITYILSSIVAMCLVATSMYVAFTPLKHDTVLGCQYRYLFPVMFPSLFVIGSMVKLDNKTKMNWYRGIILAILAFVTIYGFWDMFLSGYYNLG